MAFSTEIPNSKGPRPNTGGVPSELARGAGPQPPNEEYKGDRERREGAKEPAEGGFLKAPNENAPAPGYGGKL